MEETIIKVEFHTPTAQGIREAYFGSLAAIYEQFTPDEIGCTLKTLWASNIDIDNPKPTSKCLISKHRIIRKPQNKS